MVGDIPKKPLTGSFSFSVDPTQSELFAQVSIEETSVSSESRFDLSGKAVADILRSSRPTDWLNTSTDNTISYRPNLLIRVQRNSNSDAYSVYFGARKVGTVQVSADVLKTLDTIDEDQEAEALSFLRETVRPS